MMPGWNTGMGMDFGMELESAISSASIFPAPSGVANGLYGIPPAETLRIDDLLDFSNFDLLPSGAPSTDTHILPPPPGYSTAYAGDSSGQQTGRSFTDELYIPCEEAAELEWLSNFVDDSFSEIPYSMSAIAAGTVAFSNLQVDPAGARGARSKRSRAPGAAASNQTATTWSSSSSSSSSSSEFPSQRPGKGGGRVKGARGEAEMETGGGIRRCTHCASDKTPQWRTGPMGPKTLCNACGVRYKSGRLVPEYRPAASPTFVLTQHSNSHRKVMELRRQKEHVSSSSVRPDMLFRDYEVC